MVTGTAGIGKTALVVHWAHQVAERFPDGQLYVNLHGHSAGPPVSARDGLASFLRALGVPPARVPVDVDEAAALYRSILAERRMLVLVDNAGHSAQVRSLLPGRSASMTLVTSRDELTGLTARDGARRLALDVLDPQDATTLLTHFLGRPRVDAEPDAVDTFSRLCGYLPLAMRIAAANLASEHIRTVGAYVAQLTAGNRLTMLQVADDPDVAVQAAFDLSYVTVLTAAQRLFRLLGLAPGADFTVDDAAALADVTPAAARLLLDRLTHTHLVESHHPGRYTFHDLLRLHAAGRAASQESEFQRAAARQRLFDWYCETAFAAVELLYPQKLRLPQPEPRLVEPVGFEDDAAALSWLERERANLVAAIVDGAEHGPRPAAYRLADILRAYFFHTLHMVDWLTVAQTADRAAGAEGDRRAQAAARLSLADLYWRRSEHKAATEHTMKALQHALDTGWLEGQAAVHGTLGGVCWLSGRLDEAIDHLTHAVALNRRTGRLAGLAINLSNLGLIHGERGELATARDNHVEALAVHDRTASNAGQAVTIVNLGRIQHLLGNIQEGIELLNTAAARTHGVGDRAHEAEALACLAAAHCDLGRYHEALDLVHRAQVCLEHTEYRRGDADTINTLAEIHARRGRHEQAIDQYRRALDIARRAGDRYPENAALLGLAEVHLDLGCVNEATSLTNQALRAAQRSDFRIFEGNAYTLLARLAQCRGQHIDALAQGNRALARHRETGYRLGEAKALAVLADILDGTSADKHRNLARAIFADIGIADHPFVSPRSRRA